MNDNDSKLILEQYKKVLLNEESPFDREMRVRDKKFPWCKKMEENNDIMSNIMYSEKDDELVYSIAFLPDYVYKKPEAIAIAMQVFPKLKRGYDRLSYNQDTIDMIDVNTGETVEKFKNLAHMIGDKLASYDVSLSNSSTGYWDLDMTVKNASNESPNKLINSFNLFYKAVEYLAGEQEG